MPAIVTTPVVMALGDTRKLGAQPLTQGLNSRVPVSWASDNPAVVALPGLVNGTYSVYATAVGMGMATVTATAGASGIQAAFVISVVAAEPDAFKVTVT